MLFARVCILIVLSLAILHGAFVGPFWFMKYLVCLGCFSGPRGTKKESDIET